MSHITVPPRAFFSWTAACHRFPEPPRVDGQLKEWSEPYRLPDLMGVEGLSSFGEVFLGWDESGLYAAVAVKGKTEFRVDPRDPASGDCLELFVDTRDVKDMGRGTRYCHRFHFLPGGSGRNGTRPIGRQAALDRAREQAPPCAEELIQVGLRRLKRSYTMEIKIAGIGLNGFQPGEFDRLGFTYLLHDGEKGTQSWAAGDGLPVDTDPSTWGTVELVDAP